METFVINDQEHELKLTLKSVKYLNGLHDGGAFILLQRVITGDIDTYVDVVFAGLMHTGKGFSRKTIEKAIDKAIENEELDLDGINKTMYHVVADSFFYRGTIEKMFEGDEQAREDLKTLMA